MVSPVFIIVLSLSSLLVLFTNTHTHKLKKVTQVKKFNLKNQALKTLKKKLEQQLEQKKEAGKANYEVENKCKRLKQGGKKDPNTLSIYVKVLN